MRTAFTTIALVFLVSLTGVFFIQGCKDKPGVAKKNGHIEQGFQFKEKLSEYNFFQGKINELKPQPGVFDYELVTPLFTDYAIKDRFIVLPALQSIRYTAAGILDFPDSTIIIKNFAYRNVVHRKIMLETRLLVKDPADSKWKVMNYLWNAEQTDAIKHIIGAKLPITLLDDGNKQVSTVYQVPNTNDCKRCHINNDTLTPIGPKARNLNFSREGQRINQLVQWANAGRMAGMPVGRQAEQLPDWRDSKHYTLEQRARAYMDVNCAHCHTKGGDAYNTGLFLEYQQADPYKLGIMKAPVSAGGGGGGLDYDIVPGDAAHSILAYRMNSAEPGTAMPELARSVIHQEGVQLIVEWINSLPKSKK
jgi:uncharacterized repeat protein (TIGR03806 family)